MRKVVISLIIIILVFFLPSFNLNEKKQVYFNLSKYIYETQKLNQKEYKFSSFTYNNKGDIIYLYQLYKARGTLLININTVSGTLGYRLIPQIKVPSICCINNKNELIIFERSGGNKIHYISPSVNILTFDNPSFPISIIKTNYEGIFYWLGYNYKENKKTDGNIYLFTMKSNKINKINLTENLKNQKILDVVPVNTDSFIAIVKSDKGFKAIKYDKKTTTLVEGKKILINSSYKDTFYISFVDGNKMKIYKYLPSMDFLQELYQVSIKGKEILYVDIIENIDKNYIFYVSLKDNNEYDVNILNVNDNSEQVSIASKVLPFLSYKKPLTILYPLEYFLTVDLFE